MKKLSLVLVFIIIISMATVSVNALEKTVVPKDSENYLPLITRTMETQVNSCTVISTPGIYTLTADIINSGATYCIEISSSDVVFDGAGYTIDGIDGSSTYGVFVYKPSTTLNNVTVKNVVATDWHSGIRYEYTQDGSIFNNNATSNLIGIYILRTNRSSVTNNSANLNNFGFAIDDRSSNNIILNNEANVNNGVGFWLYLVFNNNISINKVVSNTNLGFQIYASDNNVISNNNVSSSYQGIKLDISNRNKIFNNIFNNFYNVQDNSNNSWNISKTSGVNIIGGPYQGGNYWSDYAGADNTGDGLGDTLLPYTNNNNIQHGGDYLPLTTVSGAIPINSCITISAPGNYILTTNILNSNAVVCINITASNVVFDGAGYTINGMDLGSPTFQKGVYVYKPSTTLNNVTVKNLVVTDWYGGIYYQNAQYGSVINNSANSNTNGIYFFNSNDNTVINNNASSNSYGIYLESSSRNNLEGNLANSNSWAISLYTSSNNTLESNIANSNSNIGIYLYPSSNNNILNHNNASSNSNHGIYLDSSSNNNVIKNNIVNSNLNRGIRLRTNSNNNIVINNTVKLNGVGISLSNSSSNIIFNNFFNNTINALDDGLNSWNITKTLGVNIIGGPYLGGNYWSNYTGIDQTGDGLGDTLLPYTNGGQIANSGDYLPLTAVNMLMHVHNLNTSENFSTIQNAIDDSDTLNGHIIFVDAGTYHWHTWISKSIILVGENKSTTILFGDGSNDTISIQKENVTIRGFTITDNGTQMNSLISIYKDYSLIENNNLIVHNDHGTAIYITTTAGLRNTIRGNYITGNDYGFVGGSSSVRNVLIYNNFFNNTINSLDSGNNTYNISKTAGTNIIGGPYLGGNYWSNYAGVDQTGDYLGDTLLPYNNSGQITRGGDYLPLTTQSIATPVNSCMLISAPGIYVLTTDILNSNATKCIEIVSSNVVFDGGGYTIDGMDLGSPTFQKGVYVNNVSTTLTNVTVKNLRVTDWWSGIFYQNAQYGSVVNNTASSNTNGIYFFISNDNTANNNNASSNSFGVYVELSARNTLENNNANLNTYGIMVYSSTNNTLVSNIVNSNSNTGIYIFQSSTNNILDHNTVNLNGIMGIALETSGNNNLVKNNLVISNVNTGIIITANSNSNSLTNNTVKLNPTGINLVSSNNNFIFNNYFNNTNNAKDNSINSWNTTKTAGTNIIGGPYLGGNYWSNYAGADTNGDGLGDTILPYNNSGQITNGGDRLPLTTVNVSMPVHNINTSEDFPTIQSAIDDSDTLNGHTLSVDSNTYYENVVVNKSLTILGKGMNTTIIDGGRIGIAVMTIKSNDVTVSGFTIRNGRLTVERDAGIRIQNSKNCRIANSNISNNRNGIHMINVSQSVVEKNIFSNNYWGVNIFDGSSNNTIQNNTATRNSQAGIQLYSGIHNTVRYNNCSYNQGYGIYIYGGQYNLVYGNILAYNGRTQLLSGFEKTADDPYSSGLLLNNTNNNTIYANSFFENNYGIYSFESSFDNIIYKNNFINNTQNAYDENLNTWYNGMIKYGNYWSDFITNPGYPITYNIPGGTNKDLYPVLYPWGANYTCGDVNLDKKINLLDVSYIITFLYRAGPAPRCAPYSICTDVNNDTKINLLDVSYIINYLYRSGPNMNCPQDTGQYAIVETTGSYEEAMAYLKTAQTTTKTIPTQ